MTAHPIAGGRPNLTRRQHDCMRLAIRGHVNKDIAHRLGLSVKTVDGYVDAAKLALGVRYRGEAIAKYLDLFENPSPGGITPVVDAAPPAPETAPQPVSDGPEGRGLERLSRLQRLGIVILISLALSASLALAAVTAVQWSAIYDANNPPRPEG